MLYGKSERVDGIGGHIPCVAKSQCVVTSEDHGPVLRPQLIRCVTWGNASCSFSLSFLTYKIGIIKLSLSHKATVKRQWIEH